MGRDPKVGHDGTRAKQGVLAVVEEVAGCPGGHKVGHNMLWEGS